MIKVFGQLDKVYISNGDVVLRPLKAKVTKKDNGDYYLDLETSLDYVDYFVEGNIVTANTPTGDQAFRIGNVTKSKYKLVSKCYHVYYDSKNYLIADSLVESRTCDFAIKHLNAATEPQSEFTVSSDITTLNSFRCVRKSLYEAIDIIIEKWGGHLVRDNFDIQIKESIGQDNGIIVQYKKNIKDISCQENWNNVVTKLLPVGKDGLLLNKLNPTASIYLVSSNQYVLPYTKTVSFSQDGFDQKDYPSEEAYYTALINDLREQGTKYLAKYSVPEVSYTLKANLDRVTDIGDIIEVIDERLSLHMMTNVTGYVYDCIFEQYTEVEFGNFTNSLSNLVGTITDSVNKAMSIQIQSMSSEVDNQFLTVNQNVSQVEQTTNDIIEVMNDSYVTYDGDKIMIYQTIPNPDEDDIPDNMIKISFDGVSRSGDAGEHFTPILTMDGEIFLHNLTLKNGNDTISNFILAEGITDGWNWRKYTSGKVEAWTQLEIDSTDLTWTAFSTLQQADVDITFPLDISNALILSTMETCPDVGWVASATTTDETGGTAKIIREGNTGDFSINIYVKGEL